MDIRLVFVVIVWGVNFAFVKYALRDFSPLSFTAVRFCLGAVFLLAAMHISKEQFYVERSDRKAFIRLGAVGIVLYNIFFMFGLERTTASNSALIIALSPLFAGIIQSMRGHEHLAWLNRIGIVMAAVGVALVIEGRQQGLSFSASGLIGDLLTLCASFFWALYTLNAKPLLEKYSPLKVTAYSMTSGSIMLLPAAAVDLVRQSWAGVSAASWGALFFAAFISGGTAFTFWYKGVQQVGATGTIVYHYFVPLVAVVFAALFLDERISFIQIAGGALVIAGVAMVRKINAYTPPRHAD